MPPGLIGIGCGSDPVPMIPMAAPGTVRRQKAV
jgi:hypothetical protein